MVGASNPQVRALVHDAGTGAWLVFGKVREIRAVESAGEVRERLRDAEAEAERGRWTVAFVTYEAASGLDSKLVTRSTPPTNMPVAWFATCEPPRRMATSQLASAGELSMGPLRPSLDSRAHADGVRTIHQAIARGDTYQVNFTHAIEAPFSGSAWGLFRRLWSNQQAAYAAWIDTGRHVLCSASPELFFELDGVNIVSRPMKGTAPRGRTTQEDRELADELAASPKNRSENVMIVDMIRNDLGRIAEPGSVQVSSLLDVERYPSVFQLTSTVEARTSASVEEIFAALFPCASITGAPKRRTMEIIAELESRPRGVYTGAIGWIAPERRARFSVAIRTAVVDRATSTLTYGTGGGIVWESEPEAEYQECSDKTLVLSRTPPTFSLLETILWTPGRGYRLLERHLDRLADSADFFDIPLDRAVPEAQLEEASRAWGAPRRVRLTVAQDGTVEIHSSPFQPRPVPWRVALAKTSVDRTDVRLYHKTTQREIYERAAAECPGVDDVVLWNQDGELTETTVGNLVLELDDGLWTPPVSSGLLAGTERAVLLQSGRAKERVLPVSSLTECRNLWVANSVHGLVAAQLATSPRLGP